MMYHLQATFGTTYRILSQLLHDHRTVGMVFLVPIILLSLLRWIYDDQIAVFNLIAPALLGLFPLVIMFLITSIATLRERTVGTFERLMVLPIGKIDIVLGYMLAFGLLASLQAVLAGTVLIYGLGLDIAGPVWFLLVVAVADALLGAAIGIFLSAFARTEFQAIQFMPAFIFPQFLLCGLLVPLDKMPQILEVLAYFLPLTYAVDALQSVATNAEVTGEAWRDLAVIIAFVIGSLTLGALTLRRQSK